MTEVFQKQRERFTISAKKTKIESKKQELANEDYKIIKCAEAMLAQYMIDNPDFEFPYDLSELIPARNEARDIINQTEKEIAEME